MSITETDTGTLQELGGVDRGAVVTSGRAAARDAERAETRGIYERGSEQIIVRAGGVVPPGFTRVESASLEDRIGRTPTEQGTEPPAGSTEADAGVTAELLERVSDLEAELADVRTRFGELEDKIGAVASPINERLDALDRTVADRDAAADERFTALEASASDPAEGRREPAPAEDKSQPGPAEDRAAKKPAAKKAAASQGGQSA